MGVENQVVRKYGREYWEHNKKKILKKMNRHGALDAQEHAAYPSKLRRYMGRHPEEFTEDELRRALGGDFPFLAREV